MGHFLYSEFMFVSIFMIFIKFNEFRIILLFTIEYIVIPLSLLKDSLFVTEVTQLCNDLHWDIKDHTSI